MLCVDSRLRTCGTCVGRGDEEVERAGTLLRRRLGGVEPWLRSELALMSSASWLEPSRMALYFARSTVCRGAGFEIFASLTSLDSRVRMKLAMSSSSDLVPEPACSEPEPRAELPPLSAVWFCWVFEELRLVRPANAEL